MFMLCTYLCYVYVMYLFSSFTIVVFEVPNFASSSVGTEMPTRSPLIELIAMTLIVLGTCWHEIVNMVALMANVSMASNVCAMHYPRLSYGEACGNILGAQKQHLLALRMCTPNAIVVMHDTYMYSCTGT